MSEYEAKANKFLKACGASMSCDWLRFAPYFTDDKDSRDVYRVTFRRGWKTVGQRSDRPRDRFSVKFGQSIQNTGKEPTAYDVLTCLEKNDPGTFEDWCGELGYDTDSRKALKTWKACARQWAQVSAFFTADELDKLRDIQ